jgi:hypothetical protein
MKRYMFVGLCLLALSSTATYAQTNQIPYSQLLRCEVSDDAVIRGLRVERGSFTRDFRTVRLVLENFNFTESKFQVTSSLWKSINLGANVRTFFYAGDPLTGVEFRLHSGADFQPLSGVVIVNGRRISFRTCGAQMTSNYYWTDSSMFPLEGFSCPLSGVPAGCPGLGTNSY